MLTFADARWGSASFPRKILVGVGALALIASVAVIRVATASADTSVTRRDSFESGAFSSTRWSTKAASIGSTGAHDNRRFARLTATGAGSYVSWPSSVVQQGHRAWSVRAWFRVGSRGADHSVGLLTIRNRTRVHNADLFIEAPTGRCRVDLLSTNKAVSAFRCDDQAWHLVEMRGDYGAASYTLAWRLDGVAQPSITSTGQPPSTVLDLWVGDSSANGFGVQPVAATPTQVQVDEQNDDADDGNPATDENRGRDFHLQALC